MLYKMPEASTQTITSEFVEKGQATLTLLKLFDWHMKDTIKCKKCGQAYYVCGWRSHEARCRKININVKM